MVDLFITAKFPKLFLSFSRTLLKCIVFINRKKALGSRFFTSDGAIAISMGREIWRGYYQSARQGWERVLLNINMASSLFIRAMQVIDYLYEITKHDVTKHKGLLSETNRIKFTKEIKSMFYIERSYVYLEYNKNVR